MYFRVPRRTAALAAGMALAGPGTAPGAAAQETLTVFAAASLSDGFAELGRMFEARNRGVRVRFNLAGSQQLALQLTQGARADVFASADERWMAAVVNEGLASGEPRLLARNSLVVILPAANPGRIERLHDLAGPGLRLVLAAPSVPAGRYAREALTRLEALPGFGPGFAGRVLANVASLEENVRSVVAKVQLGEADAGVVYRSDVTGEGRARLRVLELPDAANVIARYPIVALKESRSPDLARAFVELALSPLGQDVLRSAGLLPAADPAEEGP